MMKDFFEEPDPHSLVKARIVSKYFGIWSKIIAHQMEPDRLIYIDLFCGPGQYEDGTKSTPMRVLRAALDRPKVRNRLVALFNDADPEAVQQLQESVFEMEGIDRFRYEPQFSTETVDKDTARFLMEKDLYPTLLFVDPFGYKGIPRKLMEAILKDPGGEAIFFFNYRRINPAVNNPVIIEPVDMIFGKERAEYLRERFEHENLTPREREEAIIDSIGKALTAAHGNYVLPFRFFNEAGTRITHHLIFVTKHKLGYSKMKEVMAGESKGNVQGVPTYEYNPRRQTQPAFIFNEPIRDLAEKLLDEFAGQALSVEDIYFTHHLGKPYLEKNYKSALKRLEHRNRVSIDPPATERRGDSLSNTASVTFPG